MKDKYNLGEFFDLAQELERARRPMSEIKNIQDLKNVFNPVDRNTEFERLHRAYTELKEELQKAMQKLKTLNDENKELKSEIEKLNTQINSNYDLKI